MFPTKILLATDGSAEAMRAARVAMTLSKKLDSELHVVHVEPIPSALAGPESVAYGVNYWEELRRITERDACEKLDEELERLGGTDEVAGAHAKVGRPDAEIVRLAEELGADLVVVGNRGLGPVRRVLMGSVATSVVRHAHGSVLVARGDGREEDRLGRILLALDGSGEADAAARAAVEISNAIGSELHILFVLSIQENLPYTHSYAGEAWKAALEQAKHDAREFVDHRAKEIEHAGGRVKEAHLALGRPEAEIAKLGEELEADLIVVGSRGLGGLRRVLLGSVSDSVIRHAQGSVLVVREATRETETVARPVEKQGRA